MPLTNTKAQTLIANQMEVINTDKTLTITEKTKLLALLNNSMVRNSHVQIRAMRLASTVTMRKQLTLPKPNKLLQMPVLLV